MLPNENPFLFDSDHVQFTIAIISSIGIVLTLLFVEPIVSMGMCFSGSKKGCRRSLVHGALIDLRPVAQLLI